jgi:hypothetical protein
LRISSQSRHSARTVRTKRSAIAFVFGARTGVLTILDALVSEDFVEGAAVFAVSVADQPRRSMNRHFETPQASGSLAP